MASSHQYDAVATEEGSEDTLYAVDEKLSRPRARYATCPMLLRLLPWAITTMALILLAVGVTKPPSAEQCTAKLSVWSPAMEAVEYQDVQFQNRFNEKSPYRGKPTAELEKAWLDLWNFGPVNIPLHKLKALNKSGDADWQRTKMDKGGGVIGSLEVFHQIHCLDMIRQYTYRDDYDYSKQPAFDGTPEQVRHHVDHCINSLRIFLQCTSDVTPYLILRDPKRPLGIDPDFQTQHKCRNFEKIQEWARKHELDTNDYQNDIS